MSSNFPGNDEVTEFNADVTLLLLLELFFPLFISKSPIKPESCSLILSKYIFNSGKLSVDC